MSNIQPINKVIIQIAKYLKKEDVDAIKFLYHDSIGDGVLEEASTALKLLKLLKERGELDQLTRFCEDILDSIGREDISNKILSRSRNIPFLSSNNESLAKEKLPNYILNLVAELVASDWKRLSRKLGHGEHIIEQIELDCTKTYEKCYQSLIRWKNDNDSVTWETLKTVLKGMPRHDIVREVESKFQVEENVVLVTTDQDESGHEETAQLVYLKTTKKDGETDSIDLDKLDFK